VGEAPKLLGFFRVWNQFGRKIVKMLLCHDAFLRQTIEFECIQRINRLLGSIRIHSSFEIVFIDTEKRSIDSLIQLNLPYSGSGSELL